MRPIPTLILAAGLVLGGSAASATDADKKHDPRAAFTESDTNHDGFVDHEEYHVRIVEVFYSADANKDGFLDPTELKALVFPDDFTDDDKDQNGRVSLREFLRVRFADFQKVDKDGDGVLSLDEVVIAWEGKGK